MTHTIPVTVRFATPSDERALHALAALDSAAPLRRPALIAELDDEPVAARSLADGRAVADPFRRTAALLAMLELRATQLEEPAPARRGDLGGLVRGLTEALRSPWGRESFSRH